MKYPACRSAAAPGMPDTEAAAPRREDRREDGGWLDTP